MRDVSFAFQDGNDNKVESPQNKIESVDRDIENIENPECNSTYEERINRTPTSIEQGTWDGERGESDFRPSNSEALDKMRALGVDAIPYKDGMVDFREVAKDSVEIGMVDRRLGKGGNFEKCDTALADKWNKEGFNGKTDWTPRDIAEWRKDNRYTWHERNDMKTCDLVPTDIHEACCHLGGVAECKRAGMNTLGKESLFDD